ncbi:substrate-binding domain-containing protein [Thioclava sp. A2]|uniref:substrate-binding domain-containing protein n=1 Tax=Thioclava sp. FCG-A2 TaxID=3080562 RepID=UPI00295299A9|nr:substrate-binding domain-containing protein [Thioclava sp. A2]MDV7270444.1 substrate-binding domain-containing protein [Thioclava sp. A2]
MKTLNLTVSILSVIAASATAAAARDQIQIAGSSTVLPYATIVAEAFGENTDFPTPVVESGGSSAGLKKFCEGVGENTIDIANASRKIKDKEVKACAENGVTDIMEVRIGYDGIVFASDVNGAEFVLTPEDVYKAAAAQVPVDGALVANPYTKWSEVNASLPDQDIQLFVPGTKHGTREVFETKVIEAGCEATGAMEMLKAAHPDDKDAVFKGCVDLRTDGRSVDIDGDYTETLARLDANKVSVGVFGLSFYENNTDKLRVATMSGVVPSTATIATGEYPVSRPLYFYVKKAHISVVPGLKEYTEFFVSDDLAGAEGPLAAYGLVADPELAATQDAVAAEAVMN